MTQYRLHIDIPLGVNEDEAIQEAKKVIRDIEVRWTHPRSRPVDQDMSVDRVNYRLGFDDDRAKTNYLDINEEGHCSTKKSRIVFTND